MLQAFIWLLLYLGIELVGEFVVVIEVVFVVLNEVSVVGVVFVGVVVEWVEVVVVVAVGVVIIDFVDSVMKYFIIIM